MTVDTEFVRLVAFYYIMQKVSVYRLGERIREKYSLFSFFFLSWGKYHLVSNTRWIYCLAGDCTAIKCDKYSMHSTGSCQLIFTNTYPKQLSTDKQTIYVEFEISEQRDNAYSDLSTKETENFFFYFISLTPLLFEMNYIDWYWSLPFRQTHRFYTQLMHYTVKFSLIEPCVSFFY